MVLEDEASIRSFIVINLQRAGYEVIEAERGEEALRKLQDNPDTRVCLLDIMLPDIDGFEVCRRIRATNAQVGVIMLTARSQEMDKVTGLMTGADDYVTKPFNPMEVLARVKSQLRRYTLLGGLSERPELLVCRDIVLDDAQKRVTQGGEEVSLTPIEYSILKLLMENRNRVFSSRQIYESVWNDAAYGAENTVAVHIRHLREKLEIDPANPRVLKVVWGHGYKLSDEG